MLYKFLEVSKHIISSAVVARDRNKVHIQLCRITALKPNFCKIFTHIPQTQGTRDFYS